MTVSSTTNRKSFAGDGVTTSFGTSPVVFFNSSELVVQVITTATGAATTLVENTNYTVSGGSGSTGTVNLAGGTSPNGAPSASQTLLIRRVLPLTQTDDFVNNDINDAEVTEDRFDKTVMQIQQLDEELGRGLTIPASETATDALTVLPFDRASKFLAFDASKNPIASPGPAGDNVPVSSFMATVLDDTTAAAARTTLGALSDAAGAVGTTNLAAKAVTPAKTADLTYAQGRLTLTSGTAVSTSDVTGATTVYFTPYKGNLISLYDGTDWVTQAFTELSQTTADTTKSPAAVANNSNYDIFVWNDSGTLRATRGPAWTSDTARGTGAGTTELELLEGRYVNKVAITNGPAAQRGLYVGTIRSDGSAQINDSAAKRHVWNAYNKVIRPLRINISEDSHTYTTATWRQYASSGTNQVDVVRGLDEDAVRIEAGVSVLNTGGGVQVAVGIGVDTTSELSAGNIAPWHHTQVSNLLLPIRAQWTGLPGIGWHYFALLEYSAASGTSTWYGDNGAPTTNLSGIHGEVLA